jgi:hypothetical protein
MENCCENKGKENCEHGGHGCCGMKKCHMMKKIFIIIILIIVFCMGTQWGEMRSFSRGSNYGRGMMWGNGFESRWDKTLTPASDITVDTSKDVVTPKQ